LIGDIDFDAKAAAADGVAAGIPTAGRASVGAGAINFARLPGTRQELDLIAELYGRIYRQMKPVILRDDGATESAARDWTTRSKVIHLATHGFFTPANIRSAVSSQTDRGLEDLEPADNRLASASSLGFHPGLLSGVVFAGVNDRGRPEPTSGAVQDDGILTGLEVAELNLSHTDLVVLSACETGLGQVAGGEGVLGLQRAFQLAGVSTTVTSLWKVDDGATRTLMTEFYRNLWEQKMEKLESLRAAQLTMLQNYDRSRERIVSRGANDTDSASNNSPYYWAAFVLSGDWR
jgi:CHAT domain-containing protein